MARGASPITRAGVVVLALLVAALMVSWAWATFRPTGIRGESHGRIVRVQVLNGSGDGGVGSRLASFLREGGFAVVDVRNADRADYFATLVVARRADRSGAAEVARYLGRPPVIEQTTELDLADVTVVIGRDRSRIRLEP